MDDNDKGSYVKYGYQCSSYIEQLRIDIVMEKVWTWKVSIVGATSTPSWQSSAIGLLGRLRNTTRGPDDALLKYSVYFNSAESSPSETN